MPQKRKVTNISGENQASSQRSRIGAGSSIGSGIGGGVARSGIGGGLKQPTNVQKEAQIPQPSQPTFTAPTNSKSQFS